ncbi:MAG: inorganic phosphate transporter [Desulfuromonas sp.]|nr:inorganic phosphate transporter [Desulfuromonas sp.]
MPDATLLLLIAVITAALVFDYVNGFHDTANAIATSVSTRALSVRTAITIAAVLNFAGAMASTAVAKTIGKGIVDPGAITQMVVLAGVLGAILWNLITWYFGLPSSSSHAIIGGMIGAVIAHAGFGHLQMAGLQKIILALILSPIFGTFMGFAFMVIFLWAFRNKAPYGVSKGFRRCQVVTAAMMSFSHGTADAQKSMGIITMALLSYGTIQTFEVPMWVKLACALAMALGTAAGGWRIIKTVGRDFVKLQPVNGFSVDASASSVILIASLFGMPTSTTHVVTSSILGVGLSKRMSAVNWKIAGRILIAWVLTIPASAVVAFITYATLSPFLGQ